MTQRWVQQPGEEIWALTLPRQAARRDETAPFGFATRVAAQASQQPGTRPSELAWDRLAARWLAGAVAVLVVCVAQLPQLVVVVL